MVRTNPQGHANERNGHDRQHHGKDTGNRIGRTPAGSRRVERAPAPGQGRTRTAGPVRGGRRDQGHHIGQNEPRRRMGPQRHRSRGRHLRHATGRTARRHAVRHRQQRRHEHKRRQRCIVGGSDDLDAPGTPHRRQVRPVENKRLLPNHNDGDRSKPVPPERVELSLSD